jgi:dTDP-4-amino-4,6-dideoxygalactose transaminase
MGIHKYDVVNRVSPGTVCRAAFNCLREQHEAYIRQFLPASEIMTEGKNIALFNYGRSVLCCLFEQKFAGKEVIFPAFICPTVVMAAVKAGVTPNLVDVNLEDFNIDIDNIPEAELARADALFVNHTFGVPADMDRILQKTQLKPLFLIEDIAQALFARYKNEYVGTFGDAVLLSMYKQLPNTNGAVLLSDLNIEQPRRSFAGCGELACLFWLTSGPQQFAFNLVRKHRHPPSSPTELPKMPEPRRPSALSRSLFTTMLPTFPESVERKRAIIEGFQKRAGASKYLIPQHIDAASEPSGFNFSVRLQPKIAHIRDSLLSDLRRRGIFLGRLWHDAPASLPFFKEYLKLDCPNAQLLAKSVINLPVEGRYRQSDVDFLFNTLETTIERLIS